MNKQVWEVSVVFAVDNPADAHRLMDRLVTQLEQPRDGVFLDQIGLRHARRRLGVFFQRVYRPWPSHI